MIGDDSTTSASPVLADEHRERPVVAAAGHRVGGRRRRIEQRDRNAPSSTASSVWTATNEDGQHGVAVGARSAGRRSVRFATSTVTFTSAAVAVGPGRRHPHHAVDRRAGPHGPPDDLARRRASAARSRSAARQCRTARDRAVAAPPGATSNGVEVDLVLDGLVPRPPTGRRRRRRNSTGSKRSALAVAASMLAMLHLQAPDPDRHDRGGCPGSTTTSVRIDDRSEPSAAATAGGTSTPNCHRSWFLRAEARYG